MEASRPAPVPARQARRRLPARHLLALPTVAVTVGCFAVPLALVLVYSFGSVNLVSFNVEFGWTVANYQAFTSALYVHTLIRSLALSAGTTAACAVLGLALAYFISRQGRQAQRLLLAAVIVPFWTSFVVRTYAWVGLLQNGGPVDRLARAGRTGLAHRPAVYPCLDRDRHRVLLPTADGAADLRVAGAD